ncbi:hypothetical protein ACHAW5_004579 [Stephanodiscus triporus]|uniref:Uncharacterized protein n=1 Tax=Stephanodiscus triporus TaxID=2934178 RepID=A0ABD3NZ00_9STRA
MRISDYVSDMQVHLDRYLFVEGIGKFHQVSIYGEASFPYLDVKMSWDDEDGQLNFNVYKKPRELLCANERRGLRRVIEIGVGVDLGTTNSAVAIMTRAVDGGASRPFMVRIIDDDDDDDDDDENGGDRGGQDERDERGGGGGGGGGGRRRGRGASTTTTKTTKTTIPSVVSIVPAMDASGDEGADSDESRWRWMMTTTTTTTTSSPPSPFSIPMTSDVDDAGDVVRGAYRVLVGKDAERRELDHPTSTYRNVKRVIGTGGRTASSAAGVVPNLHVGEGGWTEKKEEGWRKKTRRGKRESREASAPSLRRQLEDARENPALLTCKFDPSSSTTSLLTPEQISACVLRRLYDAAERECSRRPSLDNDDGDEVTAKVTRAVIGVPAYFTESQRAATVRASELAGVSKVRLLAEPEAAALAYYHHDDDCGDDSDDGVGDNERNKRRRTRSERREDDRGSELILVFDLGGGTFDVSILEVGGGVTEVLATMGNNRLGGTDFDLCCARYLCERAVEYGIGDLKREKGGGGDDDGGGRRNVNDAKTTKEGKSRRNGKSIIKDWLRHGSGEVRNIILRTAERVRICLSNRKSVDVILPLTEDGWRRVSGADAGVDDGVIIGPRFNKSVFEMGRGMTEGDDYIVVTIDRRAFESACVDELQMLLQPLREVAIMARVMLPGEARPSFVENVMADVERSKLEEEEDDYDYDDDAGKIDFWGSEDNEAAFITGGDEDDSLPWGEEMPQNERALQRLREMDVKSQKKAQQRGRKRARDIDKRERSYRKQKQVATEDAATASLLGRRLGGNGGNDGKRVMASSRSSTSVAGNERVQEGIHGRPLSRVVLVGGATRMPVIGRLLEAVVGIVPQRTVNPDEAVALGCAVQVGILDGENDGLLGGVQAVLSPMQAAIMRALAIKERRTTNGFVATGSGNIGVLNTAEGGISEMEKMAADGSMLVVDEFDDEDEFY